MADKTIPAIQNLRGNIGIGTATPEAKLDIKTASAAWNVGSSFNDSVVRISGEADGTNQGGLGLSYTNSGGAIIGSIQHGNDYKAITMSGRTFKFEYGSAQPRFFINSAGNVGIGTTSPVSKLTVESSANALADVDEPENHHLLLRNPANDTTEGVGMGFLVSALTVDVGASILCKRVGPNAQSELQFWNKQNTTSDGVITQSMTIAEDGNVGIGESNPEQKLTLKGIG